MQIQIIQNGSSSFISQSSAQRKVLVNFIINKSNNKKWLNYAKYKFSLKSKFSNPGPLEPEDYVSNAIEIILRNVIVIDTSESSPFFQLSTKNKIHIMSSNRLTNYFLLLIKWNMSHEFRNEENTLPLPHQDDNEDGESASENYSRLNNNNSNNDYIVQFDDPFDQSRIFTSKVFIEECCISLEKENTLYRFIFEELLNKSPNRDIAKKYKLCVRNVENIRKIINRRIRLCQAHNDHPELRSVIPPNSLLRLFGESPMG